MRHVLTETSRELSQATPAKNSPTKKQNATLPAEPTDIIIPVNTSPSIEVGSVEDLQPELCNDVNRKLRKVVEIISEESGLDQSQLGDETAFVTIGIDSILALIITSRLKEELGFDIGPRSSIFDHFSTVGGLKNELARLADFDPGKDGPIHDTSFEKIPAAFGAASISQAAAHENGDTTAFTSDGSSVAALWDNQNTMESDLTDPAYSCTSITLQRSPDPSPRTLILFPDGSGSPNSYIHIPQVHPRLTIVGLVCPFRHNPLAMFASSLDTLMDSYLAEIRRLRPRGPYILGGWSSGGILAFESARRFMALEEIVSHLVLIDSPAPTRGLQRLPSRFYKHAEAVGVFGQINAASAGRSGDGEGGGDGDAPVLENSSTPEWLIPHFKATISLLHDYRPEPLPLRSIQNSRNAKPRGEEPKTSICWATQRVFDGVKFSEMPSLSHHGCDDEDDDGDEGVKFLTEARIDLSAGAWSGLLSGRDISVEAVEADHFGMMVRLNILTPPVPSLQEGGYLNSSL